MKKIFLLGGLLGICQLSLAQLYISSDTLTISSATQVSVVGDFEIVNPHSSTYLEIADTLHIGGDVILDSATIISNGWLGLNGNATQLIYAAGVDIPKLKVDNDADVKLGGPSHISDHILLQSGKLITNLHRLQLGKIGLDSGVVSGSSVDNYIVTDSVGQLERYVTGPTFFPVGDMYYTPVKFTPSNPDTVSIGAESGIVEYYPGGALLSSDAVNTTWFLNNRGRSNTGSIRFYWPAVAELLGFNRDSAVVSRYDDSTGTWLVPISLSPTTSSGSLYSQVLSNTSEFGRFSVQEVQTCLERGFQTFVYNQGWNTNPYGIADVCDSIVISSGIAKLTSSLHIRRLTIEPGASLDMNGYGLRVDQALLKADTSVYAQLIGDLQGELEWQTFLQSDHPRWYNTAFPVKATVNDINGATIITAANISSPNIQWYDATQDLDSIGEGSWLAAYPSDSLGEKAYRIYLSPAYGGSSAMLSAKGRVMDGDVNLPLFRDTIQSQGHNHQGWNYLPNPYPSGIVFDSLYDQNTDLISPVSYIAGGVGGQSVYSSYSSLLKIGANDGQSEIAPGQGFFVEAYDNGTVLFNNTQRTFTQPGLIGSNPLAISDILKIAISNDSTLASDETVLSFHEDFSFGSDSGGIDAKKKMNSAHLNLYTETGGFPLVFNGLQLNFSSHSEDLYFESEASGYHTIQLTADYLPTDWSVLLEDMSTNNLMNIRNNPYSFLHQASSSRKHFVLHFSKPGVSIEESAFSSMYAYRDKENIYVNLGSITDVERVSIYNMGGARLQSSDPDTRVIHFPIDKFSAGVYLVLIEGKDGKIYRQKIIL